MNQRYFIYPILFIAVMQLVPLLRNDRRWHAAQIGQLGVILLACLGGLYFSYEPSFYQYDMVWVAAAAALFVMFVAAPPLLVSAATGREQRGQWRGGATLWWVASWFAWGQTGRLYRRHGAALRLMERDRRDDALAALDELIPIESKPGRRPMPPAVFGLVHIWKLSLLLTLRRWEQALAFYESVYDWGTLGLATQARLLAARAQAEVGLFDRAVRSLQFALLSPRTVGVRQAQLWATRVAVASLAGDRETLEDLLNRGDYVRRHRRYARFAAYWRGRCALARGEREEAVRMLTQASEWTRPRNRLWGDAIQEQLRRAEYGSPSRLNPFPLGERRDGGDAEYAALSPLYAHGQELVRRAEKDSAGWRALMHMGRPERVTLSLLLAMATVYLVFDLFLNEEMQEKVLLWAGNSADTIRNGDWWRVFTALFLHANLLHLAMNGAGLWLFGSAVEKTLGRWRMLAVFLVGGALGNLASASVAHYDVAIGASGGIFAVIGAFAAGVWRLRSPMYFALRRRLLLVLTLMVAADFTIGGLEPRVDNLAHVAGFFAGMALAAILGSAGRSES
ncbi:MAG TPA: rhomboid family intramembrane serine protease [Verrucomicrobiae bacterium]|nr:rhomboid family intramembrane serine protease [Verrucomicrobiae bacterium]